MSINTKLIILGSDAWLGYAFSTALDLGYWDQVEMVVLGKINSFTYDLSELQEPIEGVDYFLALDGAAFGTVREKHLSTLIARGFKCISIVPKECSKFFSNVNCLLSKGSQLFGHDFKIQFNSLIGPNVIIGEKFVCGRSLTLGAFTNIEPNVKLGKNINLTNIKSISKYVQVGDYTNIENKSTINKTISSNTNHNELFPNVVKINSN